MGKLRVLLLTVVFSAACMLPALADDIQGVIESIDASDSTVMISDPATGAGRKIHVPSKVISDIKKGDVVKAALKPGTDTADSLQVLSAR